MGAGRGCTCGFSVFFFRFFFSFFPSFGFFTYIYIQLHGFFFVSLKRAHTKLHISLCIRVYLFYTVKVHAYRKGKIMNYPLTVVVD